MSALPPQRFASAAEVINDLGRGLFPVQSK
jgi:hypothetical protein